MLRVPRERRGEKLGMHMIKTLFPCIQKSESKEKSLCFEKEKPPWHTNPFSTPSDFQKTSPVRLLPGTHHSSLLLFFLSHVPRYPWVQILFLFMFISIGFPMLPLPCRAVVCTWGSCSPSPGPTCQVGVCAGAWKVSLYHLGGEETRLGLLG